MWLPAECMVYYSHALKHGAAANCWWLRVLCRLEDLRIAQSVAAAFLALPICTEWPPTSSSSIGGTSLTSCGNGPETLVYLRHFLCISSYAWQMKYHLVHSQSPNCTTRSFLYYLRVCPPRHLWRRNCHCFSVRCCSICLIESHHQFRALVQVSRKYYTHRIDYRVRVVIVVKVQTLDDKIHQRDDRWS